MNDKPINLNLEKPIYKKAFITVFGGNCNQPFLRSQRERGHNMDYDLGPASEIFMFEIDKPEIRLHVNGLQRRAIN